MVARMLFTAAAAPIVAIAAILPVSASPGPDYSAVTSRAAAKRLARTG